MVDLATNSRATTIRNNRVEFLVRIFRRTKCKVTNIKHLEQSHENSREWRTEENHYRNREQAGCNKIEVIL